jgi:hypothetical protein
MNGYEWGELKSDMGISGLGLSHYVEAEKKLRGSGYEIVGYVPHIDCWRVRCADWDFVTYYVCRVGVELERLRESLGDSGLVKKMES